MSSSSHSYSLHDPDSQSHSSTHKTEDEVTLPWKGFLLISVILVGLVIGLGIGNQYRMQNSNSSSNPSFTFPPGCPNDNYTDNTTLCIQVLFSSHVDIGFSAHYDNDYSAASTLDHYFRTLFPQSLNTSAYLRSQNQNLPINEQKWYIYMTQWWLVSLYLDCPPNMGFYCPTDDEQNAFRIAIEQGDITWHGLPFNLEAELFNPDLFEYTLRMGADLSTYLKRLGGAPNYVSQRDVPGTTRAIIPWFEMQGIKAMTIGANQGSAPIGEGNAYIWEDKTSNSSIYMLYHKGNYGGIDVSDAVILNGFNRVALFDWNTDNAGPYSASDVESHFDTILANFRNDSRFKDTKITIVSTSLDDYINALDDAVKKNLVTLPKFDFEMGDTWIHGSGSDPLKVAQFRSLQRLWSACNLNNTCPKDTPEFRNFTRLLLKGTEHTWGADVKSVLNYTDPKTWDNWSNTNLTKVWNTTDYQTLMNSWIEQRHWAIDIPLSALPDDHPIVIGAATEFEELHAKPFNTTGYTAVTDFSTAFLVGRYNITFNNMTGAINQLFDTYTTTNYANSTNELASILYSTFTEKDFDAFLGQYSYDQSSNGWWVAYDFGKVGLDENAKTRHYIGSPILTEMYYRSGVIMNGTSSSPYSFLLVLTYNDSTLHSDFGAPAMQVVQVDIGGVSEVDFYITVTNYNKQYTRIPEALWVRFNPIQQDEDSYWTVNKIGYDIDPSNIAINGSRHSHATSQQGVKLHDERNTKVVQILSPDIFFVSLGNPNPFPVPLGGSNIDIGPGVNFCMFNNIWGTNYVEWYPFFPSEINQQYRFNLRLYSNN